MTVISVEAFERNPYNPQEVQGPRMPLEGEQLPPGVQERSVVGASFSRENIIQSAFDRQRFKDNLTRAQSTADLNEPFNIAENIPDRHASRADVYLSNAIDKTTADMVTQRLDQQIEDERTIQEGGGFGLLARFVASASDPTSLPVIPLSILTKMGTLGKVAMGAGVVGGSVAAQELILQNQQDTRTVEETNLAIGMGTVIGGVLGPIIARSDLLSEVLHEAKAAARGQRKFINMGVVTDPAVILNRRLNDTLVSDLGKVTADFAAQSKAGPLKSARDISLAKTGGLTDSIVELSKRFTQRAGIPKSEVKFITEAVEDLTTRTQRIVEMQEKIKGAKDSGLTDTLAKATSDLAARQKKLTDKFAKIAEDEAKAELTVLMKNLTDDLAKPNIKVEMDEFRAKFSTMECL